MVAVGSQRRSTHQGLSSKVFQLHFEGHEGLEWIKEDIPGKGAVCAKGPDNMCYWSYKGKKGEWELAGDLMDKMGLVLGPQSVPKRTSQPTETSF